MGKNKLKRFIELSTFRNTYQNYDVKDPKLINFEGDEVDLKGKWNEWHFKNDQPIVVELACGGGEYTVQMARHFPHRNHIGVDIKGARIYKGAKVALNENLHNAAFLRTRIEQLDLFFGENEIDEIWITFPDPFLKKGKEKHRLTADRFLKLYQPLLKEDGIIQLKTDDPTLYEFTLETLEAAENVNLIYHKDDIYSDALYTPELEYKTYYEEKHLENRKTIKYVRFSFK